MNNTSEKTDESLILGHVIKATLMPYALKFLFLRQEREHSEVMCLMDLYDLLLQVIRFRNIGMSPDEIFHLPVLCLQTRACFIKQKVQKILGTNNFIKI